MFKVWLDEPEILDTPRVCPKSNDGEDELHGDRFCSASGAFETPLRKKPGYEDSTALPSTVSKMDGVLGYESSPVEPSLLQFDSPSSATTLSAKGVNTFCHEGYSQTATEMVHEMTDVSHIAPDALASRRRDRKRAREEFVFNQWTDSELFDFGRMHCLEPSSSSRKGRLRVLMMSYPSPEEFPHGWLMSLRL